jgi:chromosome segregation ATPase
VTATAQNTALPASSRLSHVLTTVTQYYHKRLADQESEISREKGACSQIKGSVDQFLISLGAVLGDDQLNLQRFISDSQCRDDTISSVEKLKEQIQRTTAEQTQRERAIEHFLSVLRVKSLDEAERETRQLQEAIADLQGQLRDERSAAKQREKAMKHAISEHRARVDQAQEALEAQQKQFLAIDQACTTSQNQQRSLESENSQLTIKIERLKHEHDERLSDAESQHQSLLNDIKSQYNQNRLELVADISSKASRIQEYSARVQKLEQDVVYWKNNA